jgi:hypothetical protein
VSSRIPPCRINKRPIVLTIYILACLIIPGTLHCSVVKKIRPSHKEHDNISLELIASISSCFRRFRVFASNHQDAQKHGPESILRIRSLFPRYQALLGVETHEANTAKLPFRPGPKLSFPRFTSRGEQNLSYSHVGLLEEVSTVT